MSNCLDGLQLKGIIHVGAHLLEENDLYERLGLQVMWIDANPFIAAINPKVICTAISNRVEETNFIVTNNNQSSSLFRLKDHRQIYPDVIETQIIKVKTTTLDNLIEQPADYDALNLDVQCAELKVLMGSKKILPNIKAVYTEVNNREIYEGCPLITDLDAFLYSYGFRRIPTKCGGKIKYERCHIFLWINCSVSLLYNRPMHLIPLGLRLAQQDVRSRVGSHNIQRSGE